MAGGAGTQPSGRGSNDTERVKMGQASSTVTGAACHPGMSPVRARGRTDPFLTPWSAGHPGSLAQVSISWLLLRDIPVWVLGVISPVCPVLGQCNDLRLSGCLQLRREAG